MFGMGSAGAWVKRLAPQLSKLRLVLLIGPWGLRGDPKETQNRTIHRSSTARCAKGTGRPRSATSDAARAAEASAYLTLAMGSERV